MKFILWTFVWTVFFSFAGPLLLVFYYGNLTNQLTLPGGGVNTAVASQMFGQMPFAVFATGIIGALLSLFHKLPGTDR